MQFLTTAFRRETGGVVVTLPAIGRMRYPGFRGRFAV
jgi:hypothetical protein